MVLFGADRLDQVPELFLGRVALLTTPAGRTGDNRSTIEVLAQVCDLRLLLAPEHGIRGDKPAGALFSDEVDPLSGLPVCSLYTKDSKRLSEQLLARFDTLVYDVADVGCRYYTFLTTLRYCLEDCARQESGWWCWTDPIPWETGWRAASWSRKSTALWAGTPFRCAMA